MKHGKLLVTLILALAVLLCASCALAAPEDHEGEILNDFSVSTIQGSTFTLSESLQTHELVLINLWATWCGPCRVEFPHLEKAWEQYGSRVDVIALSIESGDTMDVLTNFAAENGLHFPIGRDDANLFGQLDGYAIPTTLIVNRERRIVKVEIGSKSSVEEFTDLFDSLLASAAPQTGAEGGSGARCVLTFRDPYGNPVPGVTVGFCNGEYNPVETDASGRVTFDGSPEEYHVHLLSVPEGFALPWTQINVYGERFDLTVTLYPN